MRRATWIFFRAYLLIALLVVVTGISLEFLLEKRETEAVQERESSLLLGDFLLAEIILAETDGEQLAFQAQGVSSQLGIPAAMHALSDFQGLGPRFEQLQAGEIIYLYNDDDQAIFYRRQLRGEWVLALGPLPGVHNERSQWVVPLFYSLLALAVFFWIRPLSRDLDTLQKSARALGEQDFTTRAAITDRSWLSPLGQAFNSMAQRIQHLLQSHRDLSHAVSHELRTPLARIRFSLEMLEGANTDDRRRHTHSMKADVEELNTLIDEMLSYAELDQENITPKKQTLDIATWLADYGQNYSMTGHSLALNVGTLPPPGQGILVDERMLTRALDNLVSNALRYAKSTVELSALFSDGSCQLSVRDDGPGIPDEEHEAVLAAYTRLAPVEGEVRRGFGLGLAIVNRIMELHGGQVVIGATPTGGADISLRWPS